ncbi:MAG: hypothetical protein WAT79_05915 [Saprospiraceae bacterium]
MGLFKTLFPEQIHILQHWQQVKSISYSDEDIALDTILYSLIKACLHNEKSIVIIPDKRLMNLLEKKLQESGLSEICLFFDPDSSVTKEETSNLIYKLTPQPNIELTNSFYKLENTISWLGKDIQEILTSFFQYDGDRNLQTVLDRCFEIENFEGKEMVLTMLYDLFPELDEASFDSFYDIIVMASKKFEPGYGHTQMGGQFKISQKYLIDESSLTLFLNEIKDQIVEFKALRSKYNFCIEDNSKSGYQALHQQCYDLEEVLRKIELEQIEFQHLPKKSGKNGILQYLGAKPNQVKEWEGKMYQLAILFDQKIAFLVGLEKPYQSMEDLATKLKSSTLFLGEMRGKLAKYYAGRKESLRTSIKYSNVFNHKNSVQLEALESELFERIQSFNDAQLLDQRIEVNTLSIQKQVEILNKIILDCTFLEADILNNRGHYLWKSFIENQEEWVQKSISSLRHFNSEDWPSVIEYCFLQRWIQDKLPMQATLLKEKIQTFHQSHTLLFPTWASNYVLRKNEKKQDTINALPGDKKYFHKTIIQNKGIEKMHWRYFFEKNAFFWSSFFDIVVTSKDSFEDMEVDTYSNLFYVNSPKINQEVLHLGKTIHTYININANPIDTDLHLLHATVFEKSDSKVLSSLERLKQSRAMAYNFFAIQNKFTIYQLKNANIISCLPALINRHIESELQSYGIKEIVLDDKPIDRLVDCMVDTNRTSYLWISDYCINPLDTNSIAIQLNMIQDFLKLGYKIEVIETLHLIENYGNTLKKFVETIDKS